MERERFFPLSGDVLSVSSGIRSVWSTFFSSPARSFPDRNQEIRTAADAPPFPPSFPGSYRGPSFSVARGVFSRSVAGDAVSLSLSFAWCSSCLYFSLSSVVVLSFSCTCLHQAEKRSRFRACPPFFHAKNRTPAFFCCPENNGSAVTFFFMINSSGHVDSFPPPPAR